MLHEICFENLPPPAGAQAPFRRLDLRLRPEQAAVQLAAALPGLVWLDSALAGPGAVSLLAAAPVEILTGDVERDWHFVEDALRRHALPHSPDWPLPAGGLFGRVGFDGRFVFGVYPHLLAYAHDSGQWFEVGGLSGHLRLESGEDGDETPPPLPLRFKPQLTRGAFLRLVRRAKEYIAAGDIYQVNLSYPWEAAWPAGACPLACYRRLRAVSPAPHAAFLDLDGVQALSASPELFLRISDRRIVTRPIKGTRPRFPDDPARDAAARADLLASAKERAELLMITDLERNDLGQVCEFGSVAVPELWRAETFPQVFHLVSTVEGHLPAAVSHARAFRACFPGGSITGAPKRRALEIIHELEPFPRGLYTGAIGGFGFNGESFWNIAIRTAVRDGGVLRFHTGAGIVADSDPVLEYEETLHKAAGLLQLAEGKVPRLSGAG